MNATENLIDNAIQQNRDAAAKAYETRDIERVRQLNEAWAKLIEAQETVTKVRFAPYRIGR
jgi:hypothetical protein